MSDKSNTDVEETPPESNPRELTEAAVIEALRNSADGANELNRELKEVFALSDTSATLRLK